MIEMQSIPAHANLRTSACSICGGTVRVNPLKSVDTDAICKKCRCKRCSIPISTKLCKRCGVAHGTPSTQPGLCEQCFERTTGHQFNEVVDDDGARMWSAIA